MTCAAEQSEPSGLRLRTCIATKTVHDDRELLRVVVDPTNRGVVLPDPKRKLPGRGAWITPTIAALETAEQRKAFGRALRVSGELDAGPVRKYIAALVAGPDS